MIESLQNDQVKHVVKLRDRKTRNSEGLFLIEGNRELSRAHNSGVKLVSVYYCKELINDESVFKLIRESAEAIEVSKPVYEKMSYGSRDGGLLAVAHKPDFSLDNLNPESNSLYIIAAEIEKPGNLGAILRSADAAGADGVIVCDGCTDVCNPNVIRASTGTLFTTPVAECDSKSLMDWLVKNKINPVGAVSKGNNIYTGYDFTKASAVVIGSEQKGLNSDWLEFSNTQIHIPMNGKADSLNAAMTATILLYEAHRQRSIR